MQPGGMAHDRKIGDPTLAVIAKPSRDSALGTRTVNGDRGAEQMGQLGLDRGVSDWPPSSTVRQRVSASR